MIVIKSPDRIEDVPKDKAKIFLAGSIEVGLAETWQDLVGVRIAAAIECLAIEERSTVEGQFALLNPRRDDWDHTWKQTRDDPQFHQQVIWELSSLGQADWILMYFDPATKSPISLLELGLHANSQKLVVVCPDGFWRKGNVDIVCDFYRIVQRDTLSEACSYIVEQECQRRRK